MRKRVNVPTWAVEELQDVVFEGWALVRVRDLAEGRSLLVYEAVDEREPPRELEVDADPDKAVLSKLDKDALSVAVATRTEPREDDVYVLTASMSYRPSNGSVTYLLPAQRLQPGDKIRVRQKLSTGVWLFDIASGSRRGMFFTVARAEWDTLKEKLRMDSPGVDDAATAQADKGASAPGEASVSDADRNSSPLAKSRSYMRVTKKLPTLPVPKKFDSYFSAPLAKRPPPPRDGEGDEKGGGGSGGGFGGFGRRR